MGAYVNREYSFFYLSIHKQQLYCLSKDYSNEPFLCNHDACILARLPAHTAVTCTTLAKHHGALIHGPELRSLHRRRAAQLRWPNAHARGLEVHTLGFTPYATA